MARRGMVLVVTLLVICVHHSHQVCSADVPSAFYANYTLGSRVFINEMHITNAGQDVDEGIEIAGPAGTDITGWTVTFYSSSGTVYASSTISSPNGYAPVVLPDQQNGFGTY
eukprot:Opistho-2@37718